MLPKFLSKNDEPTFRIRCPIHGFIRFSQNERKIIDHPLFRRLRYIRQLALTEYAYPSAVHSRFEHSLGVMEVATQAFDTLTSKNGRTLQSELKKIPGFTTDPMERARQVLRLAALLHDVGHISFSHAAEKQLLGESGHEGLSCRIISDNDLLGGLLNRTFFDGISDLIVELIELRQYQTTSLKSLHDIISGQMDADRTDYLVRDAYHCGVEYGRFDYRRLIDSFEIIRNQAGVFELALHRNGIHAFEGLIIARYQMNNQIYLHKIRRIYDAYLIKYFELLNYGMISSEQEILDSTDVSMLSKVFQDAGRSDKLGRIAKRIRDRCHHRVMIDSGVVGEVSDSNRAVSLMSKLKEQHPKIDFMYDEAPLNVHNLFRQGDQLDSGRVMLQLIVSDKIRRTVNEESQILKHIPRETYCSRIYADVQRLSSSQRREIKKYAEKLWQKTGGSK